MPSASLPHASAQHGDQTLLTHALDEWHLEVHGPRSKRKLPRPKWLWLHRDWWLNMRPTKKEHVAIWQAIHWQGAAKPWVPPGQRGPFESGQERAIKPLRTLWLAECRMLRGSACGAEPEALGPALDRACGNQTTS